MRHTVFRVLGFHTAEWKFESLLEYLFAWQNRLTLALIKDIFASMGGFRCQLYFFGFLFLVTRKGSLKMPQVQQRKSHVPQGWYWTTVMIIFRGN